MTDMGDIANMRAAAKAWRTNAIASGETVRAHDKIDALIDEIERLQAALQSLTKDPPAILDEPDTDAEVIIKMREIARRALETKP
jgi:hypothetical protein